MLPERYVRYLGLVGTACLFIALLLYLYDQNLSNRAFALLASGIIALGTWITFAPDDVRGWLSGRQAASASTSLILFLAFSAFVILVYDQVDRQNITLDLTYSESFTLNAPSLSVIQRVQAQGATMRLVGFFPRANLREQETADILLRQFDQQGDQNIEVRFIDPNEEPLVAQQYAYNEYIALSNPSGDQTALFVSLVNAQGLPDSNTIRPIWPIDERSISTAIAQLLNTNDTRIYFTTGHAEFDIESQAGTGLNRAVGALGALSISAGKINLLTDDIPADAAALVIAGNSAPFVAEEVAKIADYLENRKGRLIVLANPPYVDATFGGVSTPLLPDSPLGEYLWAQYGIRPQADLVVDFGSSFESEFIPVVARMELFHPIMQDLTNDTAVVFSLATSFSIPSDPQGSQGLYSRVPLLVSSDNSYGETTLQLLPSGTLSEFEEASDLRGPLIMGVAVSETNEINLEPGTRIAMVGDVDWLTNDFITRFPGNAALWAGIVTWAIGSPDMVTIDAVANPYILPIEATEQERQRISLLTTLVLPSAVLVLGVGVWYLRRRS
jgi:hypothetical protein